MREDKNFGGSLVLDFRKRWRHLKTIYSWQKQPTIDKNNLQLMIKLHKNYTKYIYSW